jgi:DNA-binding GntR family transcriptional regulator
MERSERIGIVVSREKCAVPGFVRRFAKGYAMRAMLETAAVHRASRNISAFAAGRSGAQGMRDRPPRGTGPRRRVRRPVAPDRRFCRKVARACNNGAHREILRCAQTDFSSCRT